MDRAWPLGWRGRAADRRDPVVRVRASARRWPSRATRSGSTSLPTTRPPTGCSTASRSTTCRTRETGGFGLFYYPPTFAPLLMPFGLLVGGDRDVALDRALGRVLPGRCRGAADVADRALVDRAPRGLVVPVRLRGQARTGRPDPLRAPRDGLALDRPTGLASASPAPSGRRSRSSRDSSWCGPC